MRARHRHFNPKDAGADLVLDARFINQSDNTVVSTWADRSGNSYNATQATGANQPTFKTNQTGGNAGVDFDGTNDSLVGTFSPTAVPRTVYAVFQGDGGSVGADFSGTLFQVPQVTQANSYSWIARWGNISSTTYVAGDVYSTNQTLAVTASNVLDPLIGSWTSNSSRTVSFSRNGVALTVNGNPPNAVNNVTTAGFRVGALRVADGSGNLTQYWNGRIFSLHVWSDEEVASPLKKRCEHSSAFSFKIPCS
jgi:hypothetical protein